ncbi:MAG: hypothetical protein LAT58_06360, partial [Opitutales bacterium]|nr:hypothetical protein [Opitutales bacterium]
MTETTKNSDNFGQSHPPLSPENVAPSREQRPEVSAGAGFRYAQQQRSGPVSGLLTPHFPETPIENFKLFLNKDL